MCDGPVRPRVLGRRGFLAMGAATVATTGLMARPRPSSAEPVSVAPDLAIVPRDDWAGDLPVAGPLPAERREDVRFLLVHHTASGNDYGPDETVGLLRSFHALHTGEKGWPDVAYNFFVDRHGTVFEGRAGSLREPVKADATGGSQGFALLCCFVGDFTADLPSLAAHTAMTRLLAWLADTYGIDTNSGSTTTFVSRGSNLHPAGTEVTTPTIAGHRDMSQTACPGDTLYPKVRAEYQANVSRRREELVAAATTTTASPSTTAVPPVTSAPPVTVSAGGAPQADPDDDAGANAPLLLAGGLVAASVGGAMLVRSRRPPRPEQEPPPVDPGR